MITCGVSNPGPFGRELSAITTNSLFAKNYKLTPLDELENFISHNNHLPGFKPAAQIEKEGADVGETQRKLLEKVEELTLYIIELKKEVDQLKNNGK